MHTHALHRDSGKKIISEKSSVTCIASLTSPLCLPSLDCCMSRVFLGSYFQEEGKLFVKEMKSK